MLDYSGLGTSVDIDFVGGIAATHGANSDTVNGIETIYGSDDTSATIDDTFTFLQDPLALGVELIDGGAGNDLFDLSTGVTTTATLLGGADNDSVVLASGAVLGSFDGGAGTDSLTMAAGSSATGVTGVEDISGSGGGLTLTFSSAVSGITVDFGGGGGDELNLAVGTNTLNVANIETINGNSGNDTLTWDWNGTYTVVGGGGSDSIYMHNAGANTFTVTDIGFVYGSSSTDTLTYSSAIASANISNVEYIYGSGGNDTVTVDTNLLTTNIVDLGAGTDELILGGTANTASISNVETITGNASGETLTLESAVVGIDIDLIGGVDTLNLAFGTNSLTVTNTETVNGAGGDDAITVNFGAMSGGDVGAGGGNDTVTYAGGLGGESLDGGANSDSLILDGGSSSYVFVSNFETITGSTYDDTVYAQTMFMAGATVDGGGGTDSLNLYNSGPNNVTVTDVDTITGGSDFDTIVVTDVATIIGGGSGDMLTGGSGNDIFKYTAASDSASGNVDTITNFDATTLEYLDVSSFAASAVTFLGDENSTFTGGGVTSARFNDSTKLLEIDTDGYSGAIMEITLTGVAIGDLDDTDFTGVAT